MGGRWNRKRKAKEKEEKAAAAKAALESGSDPREFKKNDNKEKTGGGTYKPIEQRNDTMEAYYDYQGLHNTSCAKTDEDGDDAKNAKVVFEKCETAEEKTKEKAKFYASVRTILPASFRIGVDCPEVFRERFVKEVEEYAGQPMEIEVELPNGAKPPPQDDPSDNSTPPTPQFIKRTIAPAKSIPYIPHAYQLSIDRRTIRRNPALEQFHNWLKIQTSAGFVTRQETVSMIPPVVLNVQPHDLVLDLCAAPGSKTSQMLEIVSRIEEEEWEPRGLVVANDREAKRAYMLVHQLRRINSPAVFVSACDAQFYPQLKLPKDEDEYREKEGKLPTPEQEEEKHDKNDEGFKGKEGMFDRVLCDVPCSGDGTIRKNPGVWKLWKQLDALALHPVQVAIALTGARLVKVGGYMCYSTCSMNPIENESVVAEVLRVSSGALKLIDKRPDMPGLIARPGWTAWKVMRGTKKMNKRGKETEEMGRRRKWWKERRERGEVGPPLPKKKKEDGAGEGGKETLPEAENATDDKETKEDSTKDEGTGYSNSDNASDSNVKNGDDCWNEATLLQRAIKHGLVPYDTYEDVPPEWRQRIRPSCFPPTAEELSPPNGNDDDKNEKKVSLACLTKCMRCLPHDMNTGGFFVALFQKVAPMGMRARARAEELAKELDAAAAAASDESEGKNEEKTGKKEKSETSEDVEGEGNEEVKPNAKSGSVKEEGAKDEATGKKSTNEEEKSSETNGAHEAPNDNRTSKTDEAKSCTTIEDDNNKSNTTDAQDKANKNNHEGTSGKSQEDNTSTSSPTPPPRKRGRNQNLNDLGNSDFVPVASSVWPPLIKFYGFTPNFPQDQFMARECGSAKVMYFITRAVKRYLIDNGIQGRALLAQDDNQGFKRSNAVTVINSGLKAFARNNKDCEVRYRVSQDAVQFIAPYMKLAQDGGRKMVASARDFGTCLQTGAIPNAKLKCEGLTEQVRALSPGAFIVALEGFERDVAKKMFLVMWRCRGDNMNCLVSKEEMNGMRSKLRALGLLVEEKDEGDGGNLKSDDAMDPTPTEGQNEGVETDEGKEGKGNADGEQNKEEKVKSDATIVANSS